MIVLVVTGAITAIYLALLLRLWWQMTPVNRKAQALNMMILVISLGFAQYFIAGHLYNMSQVPVLLNDLDPLVPLFLAESAVPGGIAIFLRVVWKKTPARVQHLQEKVANRGKDSHDIIHQDWVRKISHVAQFLAIFAIDFIGFSILAAIFPGWGSFSFRKLDFWGLGGGDYLGFSWTWDGWANSTAFISASRLLFFNVFYCLTFFMLTSELCRHSRSWRYLFDTTVHKILRVEETPQIAGYAFFPAAYMFACIFLPYFAVLGLLAGGCLGDLASSQAGLRWGRHHFSHQSKTWEGLFAGMVVTFLASLLFLGFTLALVYLILFAFVDFCTEKPVPISDNILLPLMGILAFTLCSFLGITPAPLYLPGI